MSEPGVTRPGEAADELRAELVELLRRYGLQIPTAQRWLGDFERTVRAEERRKCAAEVAGIGSYNCELRPDGSEDPGMAAWVEGLHDAHATILAPLDAARLAREEPTDAR